MHFASDVMGLYCVPTYTSWIASDPRNSNETCQNHHVEKGDWAGKLCAHGGQLHHTDIFKGQ